MEINIEKNKQLYINLLQSIKEYRDCDVDKLIEYLDSTDFFKAPCTTQYYNCVEGGLCAHALNTYDNLVKLTTSKNIDYIPSVSLLIVALCKDFGKINYYESFLKNEKIYCSTGSKFDSRGKYEWVETKSYRVKDFNDREVIGSLNFNAYNIVSQYIPLTKEEVATILNYDLGMNDKYTNCEVLNIASKYKLVTLLHCAEILASYVDEYE